MRTKLPLLLVFSLFVTTASAPRPALTQGRDIGVGSAQAGAGGYHALVIGNNAYRILPRLKTAEADAREVAALLKDLYGFETTLLLNATRGQIVSALSGYRRRLGPESNLLVYYAGHGFNDKDADKAYWLPVDAERDDTANWIIADEITTALKVIPSRHVLVVSDSCYSGTLTRELGASLPPASEREQFLQRMAAGRSRTLMASGGNEPVADGGGGGKHSVFANVLLRGLREMDKARFTGAELFRYYVEEAVAGRAEQTPEYNPLRNSGHQSGDFVFVKLKADRKNPGAAVKAPTPAPTFDSSAFELEYWNAIKNSADPEEYKDYLKKYPNGQFAAIARRRAAGGRISNETGSGAPATSGAVRPTLKPKSGATARNRIGMEMVYVPAGSFLMGSSDSDLQRAHEDARRYFGPQAELGGFDEQPQHRVMIQEGFYMGRYEVTQAQWRAVMGNDPRRVQGCPNCPVGYISWNDAQVFISKLNALGDRFEYRLPSEAEWEYAARAGTTTDFAYGNSLWAEQANFNWQYPYGAAAKRPDPDKAMPVGSFEPNGFGLYDMHGNMWEWVADYYHENYIGAPTDGTAWVSVGDPNTRVMRGGGRGHASSCRSAARNHVNIMTFGDTVRVGLRVVAVRRS